jgi:hypothetical protein
MFNGGFQDSFQNAALSEALFQPLTMTDDNESSSDKIQWAVNIDG